MPGRILVVDDAAQTRADLSALLVDVYEVDLANDGVEGIASARENSYDLIIADVNMPRMGGLEMIANVRSDSLNKGTPIFILTTESLRRHASTCEELGARVWIVKPFDPKLLLECIGNFIPE